jgi:hypothetical protein
MSHDGETNVNPKLETTFVQVVTVTDPDSKLPVEIEIRKLESGGMVGIDASWLAADGSATYSPYDKGVELDIPDDELPETVSNTSEIVMRNDFCPPRFGNKS